MSRAGIIAIREFRRTVLTKAFFIGAVVLPVAFIAISIAAEMFLKPTIAPMQGTLAVKGGGPHLIESLKLAFEGDGAEPTAAPTGETATELVDSAIEQATEAQQASSRPDTGDVVFTDESSLSDDALRVGVRDGTWLAALIVHPPSEPEGQERLELLVPPSAPNSHVELLEDTARTAAVDARLIGEGYSPAVIRKMFKRPKLRTTRLDQAGGERTEAQWTRWLVPVVVMGLIWMTTFTGGNYLLTSTVEEKSSKVIEVLLSACGPGELIRGKVIGFGLVTLVMLAMYALVAVALLTLMAAADVVRIDTLLIAGACLIMAYLMIAAMMAGVGAAVSDITEAQTLLGPVMVVIMAPLLLIPVITEDPGGVVAIVTSYIPPLSPFILVLRASAATEPLPWIEVVSALIVGYAAAFTMIWAAGRVFRVGILMQGKPPSMRELLRWIRAR
ncbi:MAG: ABC transporter permease [Phycisphaerales bacterium]|nr:ABC transporter permease [Phycisphaerales bacterium]